MRRIGQVKCDRRGQAVKAWATGTGIALLSLVAAGCSMSGGGALQDVAATHSISMAEATPSIAVDPFAPDRGQDGGETDRLIDEDTIRLAVTAADVGRLNGDVLPWASAATGSSGAISEIAETTESGQTCRTFSATRSAYDGATLYRGEICLDPRAGWWTRSMAPVGEASQVQ